jgi:putative transposase
MVFDDFVKISDQRADQVPSFAGGDITLTERERRGV